MQVILLGTRLDVFVPHHSLSDICGQIQILFRKVLSKESCVTQERIRAILFYFQPVNISIGFIHKGLWPESLETTQE